MTPSAVGVTHCAPLGAVGMIAPMGPFCKPHAQRGGVDFGLPRTSGPGHTQDRRRGSEKAFVLRAAAEGTLAAGRGWGSAGGGQLPAKRIARGHLTRQLLQWEGSQVGFQRSSLFFGLLAGIVLVGQVDNHKAGHQRHQGHHDGGHHAADVTGVGVDEGHIAEDGRAARLIAADAQSQHDGAGQGRHHAGQVEGQLLGQGDAVDGGLGDAHKGGDHGGHRQALGLGVPGLEPDGQDGAGLGEGGGEHGSADGVAVTDALHKGLHVHDGQRHDGPVQAEHDQDLPQAAHNQTQQHAVGGCQPDKEGVQQVGDDGSHRADDQEGQGHRDHQGDEGHCEHPDGRGNPVAVELLDKGCKGHGADDGDDAGRIVTGGGHRHRQAEEFQPIGEGSAQGPLQDGGIQHGAADDQAFYLGQAKPLGGGVAQQHRHEVEEGIGQGIQDGVGAAGVAQQAEVGDNGQQAFQDTAGRQVGQAGGEDGRHNADEGVQGVELFLGLVLVVRLRSAGVGHCIQMAHGHHSLVDVGHLVADDHHVLAARLDDGDNAVGLFQHIGLGLALILQFEPQTGHTVGQADNVAFAAHVLQNDPRKTIVFASHMISPFTIACLQGCVAPALLFRSNPHRWCG